MPNFTSTPRLGQRVVQLADFVLRLRHRHAVAGNDRYCAGGGKNRSGVFRRRAAHDSIFFHCRRGGLHLAERSEHHVGEGAIHGLAHDHRENETGRSVERASHDQHLTVQNKSQQRRGKAGVGIQQRDDGWHVRAADGSDQQHSENQRHNHHDRKQYGVSGIHHQRHCQPQRSRQNGEADDILPAIDDWPLRQELLQLARGDQAARKG